MENGCPIYPFLLVFWDKMSYSPGWPWTPDPPASVSWSWGYSHAPPPHLAVRTHCLLTASSTTPRLVTVSISASPYLLRSPGELKCTTCRSCVWEETVITGQDWCNSLLGPHRSTLIVAERWKEDTAAACQSTCAVRNKDSKIYPWLLATS